MIWLIAWLVPAATLIQPLAKYVFAAHRRLAVRLLGGLLLSLLWPYFVFMVLRKKLLLEVLNG